MLLRAASTVPPMMLHRPELNEYTGFGQIETLRACRFWPMATNRCVSQDVVAQRVAQNLRRLRETGTYCDFGQILLVAVSSPAEEQYVEEGRGEARQRFARFYVLDGQHRLSTMLELARERPNAPIWFKLSIKVHRAAARGSPARGGVDVSLAACAQEPRPLSPAQS